MSDSSSSIVDPTWITEAPISYVPPEQLALKIARFNALLKDWGTNVDGSSALSSDLPNRNPLSKARTGASLWISELIEKKAGQNDKPTFEYVVGGEPIALMTLYLRSDGVIEIKYLVTHPGSVDGAGIMVEFALNKIDAYNKQLGDAFPAGVLVLESLDDESTAAYLALGFEIESGKDMVLDANESAKWQRVDGKWKLVGKPGKFRSKLG